MLNGFCPLASGSKGNAIFVAAGGFRLLIDAGLSFKQMKERLSSIGVDIGTIDAILITHEHTDHISGLPLLTERLNLPVLCNGETAKGIYRQLGIQPRFKIFTTNEPFSLGPWTILPFSIPHDTLDPVAFTLEKKGVKLGFCADLGYATSLVEMALKKCSYLYLEANHEPSMVHACSRPAVYKKRVLSRQGHLANHDAGELLAKLLHPELRHVHLAHLSSECNTPEVALRSVKSALLEKDQSLPLAVAWQDTPSTPISF